MAEVEGTGLCSVCYHTEEEVQDAIVRSIKERTPLTYERHVFMMARAYKLMRLARFRRECRLLLERYP